MNEVSDLYGLMYNINQKDLILVSSLEYGFISPMHKKINVCVTP